MYSNEFDTKDIKLVSRSKDGNCYFNRLCQVLCQQDQRRSCRTEGTGLHSPASSHYGVHGLTPHHCLCILCEMAIPGHLTLPSLCRFECKKKNLSKWVFLKFSNKNILQSLNLNKKMEMIMLTC